MSAIVNTRDELLQATVPRILPVTLPSNVTVADALAALAALANIASDSVLSKGEKPAVVADYTQILNEQAGIDPQADTFSQSRSTYDAAVTALTAYLTGLSPAYNLYSSDTPIVLATFNTKFLDVYASRDSLLRAISAKAKTLADGAQGTANTATTAAATAQTAANTANTLLANIASDSILSPSEKPSVVQNYSAITAEQGGIDAQATVFSITTEKTAYDSAVTALSTYLGTLAGWNVIPGGDVVIVGTTFRTNFGNVYTARQALLNAIAAKAKTIADTGVTNAATAQASADAANVALANIASDSVLSKGEKPAVVLDYTKILDEQSGIVAQAVTFNATSTTYTTAISALTTYLTGLSPSYSDFTTDTTIVGTTFRTKFSAVYAARQAVLNAISSKITSTNVGYYVANLAIGTGQIADNAATEVIRLTSDGLVIDTEPKVVVSYTFTPTQDAAVRATAAGFIAPYSQSDPNPVLVNAVTTQFKCTNGNNGLLNTLQDNWVTLRVDVGTSSYIPVYANIAITITFEISASSNKYVDQTSNIDVSIEVIKK